MQARENPAPELNEKILHQIQTSPQKKKKVPHFPKHLVAAAGFVLIVVLLGGTVLQDEVKAMKERLFGPITESYVYGGREQKKRAEEEICKVGETITRQGLAVTLEEVLVDANKVAYCIKVHSDERWGLPLTHANIVSHIIVNGEELIGKPSYTSWTADDHTQVSVGEVELNQDMIIKGDVTLEIFVSDICTTPATSDEWKFKTIVNVDKANSHTLRDLTTTTMNLSTGDKLIVHKVVGTSTDCKVYMTFITKDKDIDDINLHLDGKDNLGERVSEDSVTVKKLQAENEYEVVMSFSGGFASNVKKLRLAPYWMNLQQHKYKKIGEEFNVLLK